MTIKVGKTVNPALIKIPWRDLKIVDGIVDHLDFLNFVTQVASVTPNYQEGSFTASLVDTGGTFATGVMEYRIVGRLCFITIPNSTSITGVSGGTNFTITGMPSVIAPIIKQACAPIALENNTLSTTGRINIPAGGGTWVVRSDFITGAWIIGGTKGIIPQTFCFSMD